ERVFEGLAPRLEDVVIIDGIDGRRFTAGDVIDHVKRLAGGLRAAGHVPQQPIALMAPNSPEYCIIFHAVAWAGGMITTLNPTYTAHEIRHQLRDSGAGLLITDPATLAVAKEALEKARVGNTCEDIAIAFFDVLKKYGITKDNRTGYPIGVSYPPDWGERTMSLRPGDRTILQENMTFHFMTGLWMDDWGFEITESIRIGSTGPECLADVPRKMVVKD
ncbi:AMP-binding protein, partial [Planktomarina temperata]|nr:AMP-binding protein [Planktomarina temperata]